MHKLFYDVPEGATEITVEGEDFAHLTVLRIKAGETVTVSDGVSRCYTATAESFSKKGAVFSLSDPRPFEVESHYLKVGKVTVSFRKPLNLVLLK